MLIVSDATKSVYFVPDYDGVQILKRLFWYLDHPTVEPDEAMASRHFAKRSGYGSVPFAKVDLTDKEDYAKVALVISPGNALINAWSLHTRVNARRRPAEIEKLAEAGLMNRPNFNLFLVDLQDYKKALPRLEAALNVRSEALGDDSTYFDKIIRLDDEGSLEKYLKTKTDTALPSQNFKMKVDYPDFFSPKDIALLGQATVKEYAFCSEVYQFPEGFLTDAADTYKKCTKEVPELARFDRPSFGSFSVVTTLMEKPDVVRQFVNYYTAVGADKIFMYFDNPSDPSIEMVKGLPHVIATVCDDDFWQGKRKHSVEARQSYAFTHAHNTLEDGWLLAVDADEFAVADRSFPDLFTSLPDDARVVRFDSTEAIWSSEINSDSPFSADYVRHIISNSAWTSVAQFKDPNVRAMFRHGLLSHRSGKYAVKVSSDVKRLGLHRVFFHDNFNSMHPPKDHPRGKLVHFDSISFSHWKIKFVRRLSKGHGFAGFGPGRDEQHEGMRKIDEADYQKFHDSLYKISEEELELQANLKGISRLRIFEDLPDQFDEK